LNGKTNRDTLMMFVHSTRFLFQYVFQYLFKYVLWLSNVEVVNGSSVIMFPTKGACSIARQWNGANCIPDGVGRWGWHWSRISGWQRSQGRTSGLGRRIVARSDRSTSISSLRKPLKVGFWSRLSSQSKSGNDYTIT
jgi:hypothetical protein